MPHIQIGNASNSIVIGGAVSGSTTTNMVNSNASGNVFSELRTVLDQVENADEKQKLLTTVTALENAVGQSTYLEKYKSFMQACANHVTIISPFIPALTRLLA